MSVSAIGTPGRSPWWLHAVSPARTIAFIIFCSLPIFAWVAPSIAGSVVWGILAASLPLVIVLFGYHFWRRVCPLAVIAGLGQRMNHVSRRRASPFLEANYHYIAAGGFAAAIWLRLTVVNGNATALVALLAAVSALAFITGVLFTGKTWCNFFCPVSFIEKFYTEPTPSTPLSNSRCLACTGCKRACPDIDQEAPYWKELTNSSRKFAYFAMPGLIAGFYLYAYLQSGSWTPYLELGPASHHAAEWSAFLPGHDAPTAGFFFLPAIPRAVAALATLAAAAGLSVALFSLIDALLSRLPGVYARGLQARHAAFVLASLLGFASFYAFAVLPLFAWSAEIGVGVSVAIGYVGFRMAQVRLQREPPVPALAPRFARYAAGPAIPLALRTTPIATPAPLSRNLLQQRQRLAPRMAATPPPDRS